MPAGQDRLGRFVVIQTYRWALVGALFWSICALFLLTLGVVAAAAGRSSNAQQMFWSVMTVGVAVQSIIALIWHRRQRAADRFR